MPASCFCTIFTGINTNCHVKFLTHSFCVSQFQMVESVHRPIALKSSLCGGILESMCAMDCTPFVKGVLSPFFGSAFLQVTPTVLTYYLSVCIQGSSRRRPSHLTRSPLQTLPEVAQYCAGPEWRPLPMCRKIRSRSTWAYVL